MADIKPDDGLSSRREFIKKGAAATIGAATAVAGGFAVGRQVEYSEKNPMEVTDEPLEIQIRKVELRGGQEGLRNDELRSLYTWLVCSWYANNHSFGAFADPNDKGATAKKMLNAISFIHDSNDPRLQGNERFNGMTEPGESVWIDLTEAKLKKTYLSNSTGGSITPLMFMRDILVHELTHFITKVKWDARAIAIVKRAKPELKNLNIVEVSGFSMIFHSNDPKIEDIDYLDDFDEAATELIANYYQRTAGLAVGLPYYPEEDQTEISQSKIEKTLDALEATLKISGIAMDQFAELHCISDLDGLAKAFADSTTKSFQSDSEKIEYGLSVIDALRNFDRMFLGEHIQSIKA